jgi:glutamine amidotransferase
MKIAIIKYNAGNVQSVLFALKRIGYDANVTDDLRSIENADKVIFPGVGEASTAMQYLKEKQLDGLITNLQQPVLGICLGMQLLCSHSQENDTDCLGVFNTGVKKFSGSLKVPQVGWNLIHQPSGPLFKDLPKKCYGYFVHSYYAGLCEHTIAETDYEQNFSAALQNKNFYGVQFHPEKSAETGEQIIRNFLTI